MKLHLQQPEIKAAVIWKRGEILAESEHSGELYPQYSITKSVLALAIGMLLAEGKLSMTSTVGELLGTPKTALLSDVSLDSLMTMRSGIAAECLFADRHERDNYLEACLAQNIVPARFQYNNADAYLAGRMAEAAAGEALGDFIARRIFSPLGIVRYAFETDPQGHFFGASGLQLSTMDLAKLGVSVLSGELYPSAFLRDATRPHTVSKQGKGYGLFFWLHPDYWYMSGKWGQRCVMLPHSRAVIAVNADDPENRIVPDYIRGTLMAIVHGDSHAV